MPPSRHIQLTQEEDAQLREIEQDPYLRSKVRLRAQVLRLSNRGSNMEEIASYTGRSAASIARDFDRWTERGLEGLADGAAPGNPPRITEVARRCMEERLSEERTYNATQLAEVLEEEFSVVVTPEAVRQHLHRWATRGSAPATYRTSRRSSEEEREATEELQRLKKGRRKKRSHPEVPR